MNGFDISELIQDTEISKKKDDTLYTVGDVFSKYGPRLKEEGIARALLGLKESISDAEGRWGRFEVIEKYKKSACWTITGKYVKYEEGRNQKDGVMYVSEDEDKLRERLRNETVHLTIRVGKEQMWFGGQYETKKDGSYKLDKDGNKIKKNYIVKRGFEVKEGLETFLHAVETDYKNIQNEIHKLNKANRFTKGGKDSPKTYVERHDRYLTEEGARDIDDFLRREGLKRA